MKPKQGSAQEVADDEAAEEVKRGIRTSDVKSMSPRSQRSTPRADRLNESGSKKRSRSLGKNDPPV